jgi:ribosomal protein S27AE
MGWQPKTKQKRKCPRCGKTYFVLEAAVPGSASAAFLADGMTCPRCRKLTAKPLGRIGRNLPPGSKT